MCGCVGVCVCAWVCVCMGVSLFRARCYCPCIKYLLTGSQVGGVEYSPFSCHVELVDPFNWARSQNEAFPTGIGD